MINKNIEKLLKENTNRRRVELFAFSKDKTKILAHIKSNNKLPILPAGGVENNESLIHAAKREMIEESGWIGSNFKEIKISGNWILNVSPDDFKNFYNKQNYTTESSHCVTCIAQEFKPTKIFGSEGDSKNFQLYDIELIYNLTKDSINNKRKEFHKQFRLECFKILL